MTQENWHLCDDTRWESVVQRDPTAEGSFFYAVLSTGVFCRPTCPSRRPRRDNVLFFDQATDARRAGYRPCLRCRPEEVSREQQVVLQVQGMLEESDSAPTLTDLSAAAGVSPFHLQRLFKRATGLTPKQYASAKRVERLKESLGEGQDVTSAMYESGYGSSRALYDAAKRELGMTPAAYRRGGKGERITYAVAESQLGPLLIAATERGICALRFGEEAALVEELRAEFPAATLIHDPAALSSYVKAVLEHLNGRLPTPSVPLDGSGTAFQQKVWEALRQIPYGETRSYSQIAAAIGAPSAVRAVARACAQNPVALLIPCHRVINAAGGLSGYRWGMERKRALLESERRNVEAGSTE